MLRNCRDVAGTIGGLALVPLPCPYGVIYSDDAGYVTDFIEKPRLTEHWINPGIYCLHPSVLPYLPEIGSIELDVFPILAQEKELISMRFPGSFWMSVDSPKDVEEATRIILAQP